MNFKQYLSEATNSYESTVEVNDRVFRKKSTKPLEYAVVNLGRSSSVIAWCKDHTEAESELHKIEAKYPTLEFDIYNVSCKSKTELDMNRNLVKKTMKF